MGVDPFAKMVARVRVVGIEKFGRGCGHGGDRGNLAELDRTVVEFSAIGGLTAETA